MQTEFTNASASNQILLQTVEQQELQEQFLCPANRNHKLNTLDRLKWHLHNCKELKTTEGTKIFFCRYYQGHCFVSESEKDAHELQCKWKNIRGNQNDTQNYFIFVKGDPTATKKTVDEQTQRRNYEYALSRNLIKKKKSSTVIIDEQSDGLKYEFIKDKNQYERQIQDIIQNTLFNVSTYILMKDSREEQTPEELTLCNFAIKTVPLIEVLSQFLLKRIPYNLDIIQKWDYVIPDNLKNNLLQSLTSKCPKQFIFNINFFIPLELIETIKNKLQIDTYLKYLEYCFNEIKIAKNQSKEVFQFLNILQKFVTGKLPSYPESAIVDASRDGELFIMIPQIHNRVFSNFISQTTDLSILHFKLLDLEMVQLFQEYTTDFNLKIYDEKLHRNNLKMEFQYKEEDNFIDTENEDQMIEINAKIEQLKRQCQEQEIKNSQQQKKLKDGEGVLLDLERQDKQLFSDILKLNDENENLDKDFKMSQYKFNKQIEDNYQALLNKYDELFKNHQENVYKEIQQLQQQDLQKKNEDLQHEIQKFQKKNQSLKKDIRELKITLDQNQKKLNLEMEKMKPCQHLVANTFKYICPEFILCHTCKKNKINIIFYPCGHAILCQLCFQRFSSIINNICYLCEQPSKKIQHINWENGYCIGPEDLKL